MTAKISVDAIKTLREKTGAPLGDIRAALEHAGGNEAKAREWLKQKGFEAAQQRQSRVAATGRIESYVHHDGRVASLIEVNCETDFVARLPEFQAFCRDVAMQVASQQPSDPKELLAQTFIKDPSQSIKQYLTTMIAKTGENIVIRRFSRFALGETTDERAA